MHHMQGQPLRHAVLSLQRGTDSVTIQESKRSQAAHRALHRAACVQRGPRVATRTPTRHRRASQHRLMRSSPGAFPHPKAVCIAYIDQDARHLEERAAPPPWGRGLRLDRHKSPCNCHLATTEACHRQMVRVKAVYGARMCRDTAWFCDWGLHGGVTFCCKGPCPAALQRHPVGSSAGWMRLKVVL